jgi:hypothetical protein
MTFTLEKEYVYFGVSIAVLLLQLYNTYRMNKLEKEVDSIWSQLSVMAIAASSAFDKMEKKVDGKQDK